MKLHDLFSEIESTEFQSRYMLFSGFKLLRKAMSRDRNIADLINEVLLNPTYTDIVGKQVLSLFAKHKDEPGSAFDVAVAAYLYCLYRTDPLFAKKMSEYILKKGKLWWSVDLALHISRHMKPFANPFKNSISYFGDTTPVENGKWISSGEATQMGAAVPFTINGEELCNISGQFSVRSPQKTRTQVLSV